MKRVLGVELPLPLRMNRSRAAALAATLVLHAIVIAWLLMLRFELAPPPAEQRLTWLPDFLEPPLEPSPPPVEEPSTAPVTIPLEQLPFPIPIIDLAAEDAADLPDWFEDARVVAGEIGKEPSYRKFGEIPKAPPTRPKEEYPPSIWEKPLARVGKAYRTPEGEQILWVSDHCFISLGTQSLTMADFHKARNGVRRCNIGLGRKKPRDDLFEHLKRPKPEPFKKDP